MVLVVKLKFLSKPVDNTITLLNSKNQNCC